LFPYTGDGTISTSTFSPVYLTLNEETLNPTKGATTGTHLERFGGNNELITALDISAFGIISFTNRPGAITAPIPDRETEKQMLPNFDVDAVIQFELYYHAFGDPKFGGHRWTIRNRLFDYQLDGTPEYGVDEVAPTGKGVTTGSWILVRFGKGNGAGASSVQVGVE
jgi:hypothetical protein